MIFLPRVGRFAGVAQHRLERSARPLGRGGRQPSRQVAELRRSARAATGSRRAGGEVELRCDSLIDPRGRERQMAGLLFQIFHEHAKASVNAPALDQRRLLVVHRGEQGMREPNPFGVRRSDQARG